MLNQVTPGVRLYSDGDQAIARGGRQGEQMISQLHGKYYEQVYRGNVYSLNTQGTNVSTTAALATTWTGLGIANPTGSGKNLVLLMFCFTQFAAGAAGSVGILGGTGALTATLTPQNRLIGAVNSSVARGSATDTISTPLYIAAYGSIGSVATTGYGLVPGIFIDVAGSIVIPPGSFIGSYTGVALTSAANIQYVWEEVPL